MRGGKMESEYIISCFSDNKREMCGLNNIKVHTAVFTDDFEKADSKFMEIYNKNKYIVVRFFNGKDYKALELIDGSRYVWVRPNDASRGYRCSHAIIDKNTPIEVFHNLILPYSYACSKDDIEIF
jgi:hypothetical protein